MVGRTAHHQDKLEYFYFSVDNWFREYRFGINLHPWELSPGHYDEHDAITIVGTLQNRTQRKFDRGELHLLASPAPRSEWRDDVDRIGNTWIKDRKLNASAWIASDAFHSLMPALVAGRFKEMRITVCNLHRNKGATYYISLNHEITSLEENE